MINEYQTKVKVLFRLDLEHGDIVAIFPELISCMSPIYCMSYETIGQHGGCKVDDYLEDTRKATKDEYLDLYSELTNMGYELTIIERYHSHKYYEIRSNKISHRNKLIEKSLVVKA